MLNSTISFAYDDLLLIPKYSEIINRASVDTSVDLGKGITLKIPIIPANMKDICEEKMANAIGELDGLAILHRFCNIHEQLEMFNKCIYKNNVGISIGVKEEDKIRANQLIEAGCKIICIDVAHAHHKLAGNMTNFIAKKFPKVLLISGNVATGEGAQYLADNGADVIKVNVGSGSICSTRIETGNGVPSMTALHDVFKAACGYEKYIKERSFKIIADGGITSAGNLCKSLCYADAAMVGNLLAGTDETPGGSFNLGNQVRYKNYNGSSTFKNKNIEGVESYVKCKGPIKTIIEKLVSGIQSGCSYQGVSNLEDLKKDPQFVEITAAGAKESNPHSVFVKE